MTDTVSVPREDLEKDTIMEARLEDGFYHVRIGRAWYVAGKCGEWFTFDGDAEQYAACSLDEIDPRPIVRPASDRHHSNNLAACHCSRGAG